MITTLIIEDETLAAIRLEAMIGRYDTQISILAKLPSIKASIDWLLHHPHPHLMFLDIHLEDGLSFAIFEQLSFTGQVIVTTAFEQFPLIAYGVCPLTYLPKPVQPEELVAALELYKKTVRRD